MINDYRTKRDLDELNVPPGNERVAQIPLGNYVDESYLSQDEDDIILCQSDFPPEREPRLTAHDIDMLTWRDFL